MDVKKRKIYLKEYYKKHKDKIKKKVLRRYKNKREEISKKNRQYYKNNCIAKKEYAKKYYQENKEKLLQKQKPITKESRIYAKEYNRNRYKNDMQFNLRVRLSRGFSSAIKRYNKEDKITVSRNKNIDYKGILNKLKPLPRNLDNYHIDHIIPLSFFDLKDEEQLKKAWDPINFQLLDRNDNIRKSDTIDFEKYPEQKIVIEKLNINI